jgi:hypothetical protein
MKYLNWNHEKNESLKIQRGVSLIFKCFLGAKAVDARVNNGKGHGAAIFQREKARF